MRPSVHPSLLPFTFDSAVYAQGGVGARGLFGDTNTQSTPNPHSPQLKHHPTSSASGSAILQSPSLNPLSFCVAVIYSNTISLSSSSSSYFSLRFSNPPHHPPIIFRALSWLSLPKPSGLIVWSRGIESAGWNEKWGFLSASIFILFSFSLSFVSARFLPFYFSHLSFTLSIMPPPHTHTNTLCWLFHSCFFTFCGLPRTCQSHPHFSSGFHSFLPSVLCWVDWQLQLHWNMWRELRESRFEKKCSKAFDYLLNNYKVQTGYQPVCPFIPSISGKGVKLCVPLKLSKKNKLKYTL